MANPEIVIYLQEILTIFKRAGGYVAQSAVSAGKIGPTHRFVRAVIEPLREHNKVLKDLTHAQLNGRIGQIKAGFY